MEKRVVWEPKLGVVGVLIGIKLDREFALQCQTVIADEAVKTRCLNYVWLITKPYDWNQGYTPSNIIFFDDGTMLPNLFQKYTDMGKWLSIDSSWFGKEDLSVTYNFHHGGMPGDEAANRWLQFLFSRWVQFMWIEFEKRQESG